MATQVVKPRFEVHTLTGKTTRRVCVPTTDKDGKLIGGFTYEDIVESGPSYMVYFPNGSSIHLRNDKELKEAGFDGDPTLVDMETGDHVHEVEQVSLRDASERRSKPPRGASSDILASVGK
jgi:hypothetical protein